MKRPLRPASMITPCMSIIPDAPSLLEQYLDNKPKAPTVGGAPKETAPGDEEEE